MYLEIFREVVDIMHHDYAGCIDKKGWDSPIKFEEKIRNLEHEGKLDATVFTEIVNDYLLDFKEPHMSFEIIKSDKQKEYDNGFKVRRFESELYITSVGKENRFKPGDTIISLDNISVQELVERHQRELMETKAERENWRDIIKRYNVAVVKDINGNTQFIELKKYEKADYIPEHSVTRVDTETLCMKMTDFFSADTIQELMNRYEEVIKKTKNLIIDVRVNNGGSTFAYASLEKYLFPSGSMKINTHDYDMEFNCTDRNAELTIKGIDAILDKIQNEEYRNSLEYWKEEIWVKNRGKGFVSTGEANEEVEMQGHRFPENIIVLADNYCGSAGDIFVYISKLSPKVKVLGRPTMGVNDYSNLTTIKWNKTFEFNYPTSRLKSLDHRGPLADPGVKPDVYIPWTPEHIHKDIDMEEAMRMLRSKTTI